MCFVLHSKKCLKLRQFIFIMGVESYMHKYAKVVFASWLRKKVKIGASYKGLDNIPLPVEQKISPMFNIYVEYPVCKDKDGNVIGISLVGEDTGEYQHPWEQWLKTNNKKVTAKHNIPTSYELKGFEEDGLIVMHIFDLVSINPTKKSLESVFEIRHQHAVTQHKKQFIEKNGLRGYEISAEWIMNKVKSPFHVDCLDTINC